MDDCKAPIIAELGLTVASAASALMLHADEWRIHDSSTAMSHACSYSPGWGKEVDVRASVVHTERINREWVERSYRGYLSVEDILSVLVGIDLYFYADDLRERLPKYQEYRKALVEKGCECGECDLDEEDDEPQFDLKGLIKQAVQEALDEKDGINREAYLEWHKKASEKKPASEEIVEVSKPKRSRPSRKTKKALDDAKVIRDNMNQLDKQLEGK
jgi:hypothetical protein